METLLTGVVAGLMSGLTGVAIGLKVRQAENKRIRDQRDDAWLRIDAIQIRPEPKR
jgi:hypothetical protein